MRDAKLIFRYGVAATEPSAVVDANSTEPGVGTSVNISATLEGATITGDVTCTIEGSDTATGTFTEVATFVIPEARAKQQNVILSEKLPAVAKRFLKTSWSGITGGTIMDGLDWGLKSGSAATRHYLA